MLPESYIYRKAVGDRDLGAENWDIVERNFDMLFKRMQSRGFWFLVGLIGMTGFSIIEVIINTLQYHAMKPYKVMELRETNISDILRSKPDNIVETLETVNWTNEVATDSVTKKAHINKTANSLAELRDYLYSHDMTLTAKVVKSVRHNVHDDVVLEYMHSGKILKPYLTEYLDFGKEVNKALQDVIGNVITFKKSKVLPYPCVVMLNGEIEKIENELRKVLCSSEIRIKFDTSEE